VIETVPDDDPCECCGSTEDVRLVEVPDFDPNFFTEEIRCPNCRDTGWLVVK
jgi:hypothetical protein